ncbi:MAG: LysR family transcriptional regulator, partial [Hungatella sp.]
HKNISKAAREIHVSQPAISMAIHELEHEFGLVLLQRNSKGFVLTQEGKYFYERAQTLLEHADELQQMMCDMGNRRNRINLGIPPMIGTFLFPKLYRQFRQKYPEIMLNSREGGSKDLLEMLNESMLDFAIVPLNQISEASYNMMEMTQTETLFCVSVNHPLANCKSVTIEMIKDEPLIMFNDGFYQNQVIKERYNAAGYRPQILHYSSQFYTIKEFISDGIAAGFMFRDIAETVPGIVGISLHEPINIKIGLVWKLNQHMFNDATKFLSFAEKYTVNSKRN